jgi:methylated-DNA-[protein]-cysteine S-methyltransferase
MVTRLANHEKIGRALECLRRGLLPLIASRLRAEDIADWQKRTVRSIGRNAAGLDVKDCLEILNKFWDERFRSSLLGRGERAWVNELIDKVRNQHAHRISEADVSNDDTWRALDTAERLLLATRSPEAKNVRELRLSLRDETFPEKHNEAPPQSSVASVENQAKLPGNEYLSFIESKFIPDLLGGVTIVGSAQGVRSIRFGQGENKPGPMVSKAESQLREYVGGTRTSFDLAWDIQGTPFQLQVWHALAEIPYGETRSYADIARAVKKPKGAQAVGQANSRNPLLIIIPCHRVINSDGSLGGWGPGEDKKQQILDLERRYSGRVPKLQMKFGAPN